MSAARVGDCPACSAHWPVGLKTCPSDGVSLIDRVACETDLSIGAQVGDYVITGMLGEGGMATVYSAIHPLIERRVALKVTHPIVGERSVEAVQRFLQEARALNVVRHPNIVDLYSFGTLPDGRCYLVMEWVEGQPLDDLLGTLSILDAIDVLRQISDGIQGAHETGIVHRDLKPANVLVTMVQGERRVKVLDFGIAKFLDPVHGQRPQTRVGLTVGTPDYIAPEQARGRSVGPRTDVYSLGVLAFELLTGRLPFIADNGADTLAMHLSAAPPLPSHHRAEIPAALDALLLRMMAKEADDRPTMAEVSRTLVAMTTALNEPRPEATGRSYASLEVLFDGVELHEDALLASATYEKLEVREYAPPPRRIWRTTRWVAVAAAAGAVLLGGSTPSGKPAQPAPVLAVQTETEARPAPPAPAPLAAPIAVPAPSADARETAAPRRRARSSRHHRSPINDHHLVDPWRRSR